MRLRLALLALLLPATAACGSSPGEVVTESAFEIVRRAGTKTTEAGTARLSLAVEGPQFSMTGGGAAALQGVKGTLEMTIEAGGQRVEMETRMLDDVIYLKMPGVPGGKPWLKLDLAQLSQMSTVDIQALSQIRQNDPKQALAYFEGTSDDVRADGEETLRGAKTTRYQATFDLTKARDAQADADAKAAIDQLIAKMGVSTMPVTVWIDEEGRMRKMTYDIDLSKVPEAAAQGATGTMTTTFEIYDFGVRVDVTPPPADQTADGAQVLGQQ